MRSAVVVLLVLCVSSTGAADGPASPEIASLVRYLGDWRYEGTDETQGSGGPVVCNATRRWISAGYFVESHRECQTPRGALDQVELFGYDYQRRVYLYWGFNGRVVSTYETPVINDAAVVWTGTGASRGNRCTELFADDLRSSSNKCETTADGGATWALRAAGTSTRRR
jgi:hypothetical protein